MSCRATPRSARPDAPQLAKERLERVERALGQLPPHYREVIDRSRIVELPHAEITRQLGKSVDAVRRMRKAAHLPGRRARGLAQHQRRRLVAAARARGRTSPRVPLRAT